MERVKNPQNIFDEKEKLEPQNKIQKNSCEACRKRGLPICLGHGGGGGGGGDEEELTQESSGYTNTKSQDDLLHNVPVVNVPEFMQGEADYIDAESPGGSLNTPVLEKQLSLKLEPKNWLILLKKLVDLKNAGLLIVDEQASKGILTITSKVSPFGDNAALIEDYLALLHEEFTKFTKQLHKEGVDVAGFTETKSYNNLVFRIPSTTNYDRFINQLKSQDLLLSAKGLENTVESEDEYTPCDISPLSTVPVPKNEKSRKNK
ncbi:hypothetical protein [Legionella brunensis]|uniref:Uncharacterized protein n=1 Tax=Legionella brunensis TaxID=29422 RepID=A0A0W0SPS1_9GAMM|nr:hypothetical protein [Legionella brunensis]KTC85213.1 hypothetical protein Lbru_1009 [Legionella brunensis]